MLKLLVKTSRGSVVIDDYQQSSYASTYADLLSKFEFVARYDGSEEYRVGDQCELYFNQTLLATGYIMKLMISASGAVIINAVPSTYRLSKSFVPDSEKSSYTKNRKVVEIVKSLCDLHGIPLSYDSDAGSAIAVDYSVLEQDQTILRNIFTIIDPFNFKVMNTPAGGLYLFSESASESQHSLPSSEILDYSIMFDDNLRASAYSTISQKTNRILSDSPSSGIQNKADAMGTGVLAATKRKWVESSNISTVSANSFAANYAEGSAITVQIKTSKNIVLSTGSVVSIDIQSGKFDRAQVMLVESSMIKCASSTYEMIYTLVPVSKYAGSFDISKVLRSGWVLY